MKITNMKIMCDSIKNNKLEKNNKRNKKKPKFSPLKIK